MFVIKVVPTKELVTQKLLRDKGYKILCPRKIKAHRRGSKILDVEKIIFTGYLFLDMQHISDKDYYKIKGTVNVISFLDSKYSLSDTEREFIRFLDNKGKAIDRIDVHFNEDMKAIVYCNNYNEHINTKNVIRVNARDKTITFKFKINNEDKNITLNYNEV